MPRFPGNGDAGFLGAGGAVHAALYSGGSQSLAGQGDSEHCRVIKVSRLACPVWIKLTHTHGES